MEFAVSMARDFANHYWDQRYTQLLQTGGQIARDRCFPFHYLGNDFDPEASDRRELFQELKEGLSAGFWPLSGYEDLEEFAERNVLNECKLYCYC